MRTIRQILFGAVMLAAAPALAQAIPAAKMDIVGVRLGMTEAEVMRALKAFDPKAQVTARRMAHFTYSDGVNGFQTPPFLDELEVRTRESKFRIWFSSLPAESRVYAMNRYSRGNPTPPTQQQFVAAMTAKHGPPKRGEDPSRGASIAQWSEAGKPDCAVGSSSLPLDGGNETLLPPNAAGNLERMAQRKYPHLIRNLGSPADVTRCGAVLRYTWGGSRTDPNAPIPEFYVWLVDQGKMVAQSRQSDAWLTKLEAEAARKRQGKGVTPTL